MFGQPRSGKWNQVRQAFLRQNPFCAACGGVTKLEVHHIIPYHVDKGKELDFENMITLCMGSGRCHLIHGHLLDWKSYNLDVRMDAVRYYRKIEKRP